MEEKKNLQKGLRRLEDAIDSVEKKLHDTVGLLELIRLGMERLNREEDTYEISSMCVLEEYLTAINHTEIAEIYTMLAEIKEQI